MIIGAAMILFHVAHGFMPCRPTLSTFAVAAAMILFYVGHDFMPCRPTLSTSAAGEESTVVEIASNVFMPRANLGTCCGSEAIVFPVKSDDRFSDCPGCVRNRVNTDPERTREPGKCSA